MTRDTPLATAFVALGDSFTEGLQDDLGPAGRHLGWADRLAAGLAQAAPDLRYANLAVRGRLLGQVVDQQLPAALRLLAEVPGPALVSFHAGGNDLLRPGREVAVVTAGYADAVARLVDAGVRPLLFTVLERAGGSGRAADALARRFGAFNDGVRATAARHDAVLVDLAGVGALQDRRMWHADRLHLNPDGHARVAAAALERLGLGSGEPGWWRSPLPAVARSRVADRTADVQWFVQHLLPWVGRRLRGVSSGDGVDPKRARLEPVTWH